MVNRLRTRLSTGALVLAIYWLALFTATHWPHFSKERFLPIRIWDKGAHFAAYAGLAALLACVLRPGMRPLPGGYPAVLLILGCYAALDEALQAFVPGRSPELLDWLADTVGAACGLIVYCAVAMAGARFASPPVIEK